MPLIKREIQPVYVSRVKLQKGLVNEFESVSVNTLAGLIRQISSLAKYSEDVFDEIIHEADSLHKRATSLQGRISGLAQKVTQLDSSVEEISLQDINIKKAFKSTVITDQQVVGRSTLPKSMSERYNACDAPPRLQDMNSYRDDGKDALKFYTDPTYFFELWREEMKKEQDKKRKKKKHNRSTGRTQSQVKIKHVKKKLYSGKDKELETSSAKYSIEDNPATAAIANEIKPPEQNGSVPTPPPSLSPDELIPYDERRATSSSRRGTAAKMPRPNTKPPPPPPVPSQVEDLPLPQPPPDFPPPPMSPDVPPPPPPPPDPNIPAPPPPPLPTVHQNHLPLPTMSPGEPAMAPAPKPIDARTDLLQAIKTGMKLRKVQVESEKKQQQNVGMDVASILQRRIAVEYSDTESETGSEWDDDEEEWQDEDD